MSEIEQKNMKHFDASSVALSGTNLIEASAGTGKTYSIAILALRLILEEEIPVQQILMVTYTVAAVAELEQRLRNFIYKAHAVSRKKEIDDELITKLVQAAIEKKGAEKTGHLLHAAVIYLDETAVLTIHSFCQQVLNEFAFETKQLFGAGLITDQSGIITEEVQKFWRKNITTLPLEVLKKIPDISIDSITAIVSSHLSGKEYFYHDRNEDYKFCTERTETWTELLNQEQEALQLRLDEFETYYEQNREDIVQKVEKVAYLRKHFSEAIATPKLFLEMAIATETKPTFQKAFVEMFELFNDLFIKDTINDSAAEQIMNQVYCAAINEVSEGVKKYLGTNNLMTFDDLIRKLHDAIVVNDNPELVRLLQNKYRAIFIDEFQDTDRHQYEIFEKAFSGRSILFYIGDPKQSIYGFRAADIFTYLKAKQAVQNLYSMNDNYRSAKAFIDAMNIFFEPAPKFDSFYFQTDPLRIDYIQVDAPATEKKGKLFLDDEPFPVFNVSRAGKKDIIYEQVAARTLDLLTGNYCIRNEKENRRIRPADIGILVRTGKEARAIKSALAALQIPAITVSDAKIFDGEDAAELLRILEAIYTRSVTSMHTALLSAFTGFTASDILHLADDIVLGLFAQYHETWSRTGIFAALSAFIKEFNIRNILLAENNADGQRLYANLLQLMEILYKTERINNYSPKELIDWFHRAISDRAADDEYIQRIESEEEAVTIATVHKSKGLQYNIVMLPFLDYKFKGYVLHDFRDPKTETYKSKLYKKMTDAEKQLLNTQTEQEYRRLIYVAITRAVYAGFIFSNSFYKSSSLKTFIDQLVNFTEINFIEESPIVDTLKYSQSSTDQIFEPNPVTVAIAGNEWGRSSYSRIAAAPEHTAKERISFYKDEYENFVFREMLPGKKTGNLLHYIFETINFADKTRWVEILQKAVQKFDIGAEEKSFGFYEQLLDHVLNAKLTSEGQEFSLAEVSYENRIHELEFDFPVSLFLPEKLSGIITAAGLQTGIRNYAALEGMMNGFIDLVFNYEGKYYVLDWKSTYLGGRLEDYAPEKLGAAMAEHNYHLQYILYCVAIKKYLETRLPNFNYEKDFGGVFYAFVRGMRKESDSGVYFYKPEERVIEEIEGLFGERRVGLVK